MLALAALLPEAEAQNRRAQRRGEGPVYGMRVEKKVTPPDSATLALRDSLHAADSVHRADSVAMLGKSSLERPAFSAAKDSIKQDFSNGRRLIYYYGDVSVKYQDMELAAAYMEYDMNTGTVFAKGVYDQKGYIFHQGPNDGEWGAADHSGAYTVTVDQFSTVETSDNPKFIGSLTIDGAESTYKLEVLSDGMRLTLDKDNTTDLIFTTE